LRGQGLGRYEGSTGGEIVLNVDELDDKYLGVAYLLPDDKTLPRVAAGFATPNKNSERLIPQQGVSTVTNIDDIETYVRGREKESKKVYLTAFDLPVYERNKIISELGYMGITAGSLFPGLDGACEELRERNFEL
jgi:hypothetical protein